jgi:hypothetical protein
MILTAATVVPSADVSRYAWAGLNRFQNVGFVEQQLCHLHGLSRSDRQNARKQAKQIRYALIQAKEYFDAAAAVTLATKPNLLYYCIMSLAVAEILLKQTGESSLDAAREQHRHHGLTLSAVNISRDAKLETASAALVAKPLIRESAQRFGTFELWHRSCRGTPSCGDITSSSRGATSITFNAILASADQRLPLLPDTGITLLECLRASPGMMTFLPRFGITPDLVRCKVVLQRDETANPQPNRRDQYALIIHPDNEQVIQHFIENVQIRPSDVERVNFFPGNPPPSGVLTIWADQNDAPGMFRCPNGSMWRKGECRFWPSHRPLNEFGYLYVALHILGNYARYYPDKWLLDVELKSDLALAVEELVHIAEQRMALLTFGELSRTYQVIDD